MIKKNYLRALGIFRVGPDQNVARVSVTVDVTMVEDHASEYLNQYLAGYCRVSELLF